MSDVLRTLVEARALLSKPGAWCQVTLARDASGNQVDPDAPSAVSWCMFGAMERVAPTGSAYLDAGGAICARLGMRARDAAVLFNDAKDTTVADVLALLDTEIAALSGQCPVSNTETIVEASDTRELELEAV